MTDAISAEDISQAESGDELETHTGTKARIFHADAVEVIESFRRGPQAITIKDAAYIIERCGITKSSRVIEAGTGSGSLTGFLSLRAGEVVSYEQREDFHEIAKKNLERLAPSNVTLVNADLNEADSEGFDACVLDMPEPWSCYAKARELLAPGGWLCCYVPNTTQAVECVNRAAGFEHVESVEIMRREWVFSGRIAKPDKEVMHTAFLLFFRRTNV